MSSAVTGTQNEDRSNYTREESQEIRRRSLRLLGSLVGPLKGQVILAAVVLVVSTALQVAGPILISLGLDRALRLLFGPGLLLMDAADHVHGKNLPCGRRRRAGPVPDGAGSVE